MPESGKYRVCDDCPGLALPCGASWGCELRVLDLPGATTESYEV